MSSAIRSEALRAVSGFSVLAVYLVAVLVPVFVLVSDGSRFEVAGVDAETATMRLLEPLAWLPVSAAFVGAYGVTREWYYASMDRTLTGVGFARAFSAKLVAGILVALTLSVCAVVVWTIGVAILLNRDGLALALGEDAWRLCAGAVAGSVLGAPIGASLGWITRNYYASAALILVVPIVVELALLRTAPEVVRFSPGMVLAALSVPGYQDTLLEFWPALGLGLAWSVGLVAAAWIRGRRATA